MNRSRSIVMVAVMATACVALVGCSGSTGHNDGASRPGSGAAASAGGTGMSAPQLQAGYVSAIRKVLPSVVLIRTQRDLGSGIVLDTSGDIVTNDHVVGAARRFQVVLTGSTSPLPPLSSPRTRQMTWP